MIQNFSKDFSIGFILISVIVGPNGPILNNGRPRTAAYSISGFKVDSQ